MNDLFLTADIAGTGGVIKQSPEDFRVDEIPLYPPCGEGEHLYVTVRKTGLTTHQLIRKAARVFDLKEREIGYAGLKDAQATTCQTISLPLVAPEDAVQLGDDRIEVVSAIRHRNKLRLGHLAGNRFTIRIADPQNGALSRAEQILSTLESKGVPNFFGSQRYGGLENSHLIGEAILKEDFDLACRHLVGDPEKIEHPDWKEAAILFSQGETAAALERLPQHCRFERQLLSRLDRGQSSKKALLSLPNNILRLYLSAYQSALFDRVVGMRLATIDKIWPGDIACKHVNGACFRVEAADEEQLRADRFEISATAPLFGHKVMLATGQSGILEQSLLDKEGLTLPDFKLGRGLAMAGERRPLRVPVTAIELSGDNDGLILSFTLPKGSYATSLLREIIK